MLSEVANGLPGRRHEIHGREQRPEEEGGGQICYDSPGMNTLGEASKSGVGALN